MTKPPAMPEPIKTAVSKLKSAQMCNPNAVQHLIEEALAALQSAQPAEVSDEAILRAAQLHMGVDAVAEVGTPSIIATVRAIIALRPQAVPMMDEQLCEALGIDGADGWTYEVRDKVQAHFGVGIGITAQAKGGE